MMEGSIFDASLHHPGDPVPEAPVVMEVMPEPIMAKEPKSSSPTSSYHPRGAGSGADAAPAGEAAPAPPAESIAELEKMLLDGEEDAQLHLKLGVANETHGKAGGAEKHYKRAIQCDDQTADAYVNLGALYGRANRIEDALATFNEGLKAMPKEDRLHFNAGVACGIKQQWGDAVMHYKNALSVKPDDPRVHRQLGFALNMMNDKKSAIVHFREALKLEPHNTEACCNLAAALWTEGDTAGALEYYTEALRIDPQHKKALPGVQLLVEKSGKPMPAEIRKIIEGGTGVAGRPATPNNSCFFGFCGGY